MQIEENADKKAFEISIILHIIRTRVRQLFHRLFYLTFFKLLAYFSAQLQDITEQIFLLADTLLKVDNIHGAICFAFSCTLKYRTV